MNVEERQKVYKKFTNYMDKNPDASVTDVEAKFKIANIHAVALVARRVAELKAKAKIAQKRL